MGGTFSSEGGGGDDGGGPRTPTGPATRIAIDPRSPTAEINRTPIQVDKTPKRGTMPTIGTDNKENNEQPSLPSTPSAGGVRERPRTLQQKMFDGRMKKLEGAAAALSLDDDEDEKEKDEEEKDEGEEKKEQKHGGMEKGDAPDIEETTTEEEPVSNHEKSE